ncbi:BadF/BadG/BcrA/BcrD ATPase family protein [Cooperia oncophora]
MNDLALQNAMNSNPRAGDSDYIPGLGLSGAEGARDNALFIEYLKMHHGDLADNLYLTSDSVATVAAAFEHAGCFKGLGLSGAEGARDNALFIEYLKMHHGDLADNLYLTSDSVATVAAAFEHGGVILVAGTGSSCRVLLNNGRVFGVGGWGHQIGDGGSGFWIAIRSFHFYIVVHAHPVFESTPNYRAIRLLFDEDDGMEIPHESTKLIRELLLKHFKIEDKVDILEYLYNKFQKSHIASFTGELAKHLDDPAINKLFFDAGELLGKQFVVASGHLPSECRAEVNLVLVGSVFLSWNVVRKGQTEPYYVEFYTVLKSDQSAWAD